MFFMVAYHIVEVGSDVVCMLAWRFYTLAGTLCRTSYTHILIGHAGVDVTDN